MLYIIMKYYSWDNGIFSLEKEGYPAICNNMDNLVGHCTT